MVTSTNALQDHDKVGVEPTPDQLDKLFCATLADDPDRSWSISEVLAQLNLPLTLLVGVRWNRLGASGRVTRVGPAQYRHRAH